MSDIFFNHPIIPGTNEKILSCHLTISKIPCTLTQILSNRPWKISFHTFPLTFGSFQGRTGNLHGIYLRADSVIHFEHQWLIPAATRSCGDAHPTVWMPWFRQSWSFSSKLHCTWGKRKSTTRGTMISPTLIANLRKNMGEYIQKCERIHSENITNHLSNRAVEKGSMIRRWLYSTGIFHCQFTRCRHGTTVVLSLSP